MDHVSLLYWHHDNSMLWYPNQRFWATKNNVTVWDVNPWPSAWQCITSYWTQDGLNVEDNETRRFSAHHFIHAHSWNTWIYPSVNTGFLILQCHFVCKFLKHDKYIKLANPDSSEKDWRLHCMKNEQMTLTFPYRFQSVSMLRKFFILTPFSMNSWTKSTRSCTRAVNIASYSGIVWKVTKFLQRILIHVKDTFTTKVNIYIINFSTLYSTAKTNKHPKQSWWDLFCHGKLTTQTGLEPMNFTLEFSATGLKVFAIMFYSLFIVAVCHFCHYATYWYLMCAKMQCTWLGNKLIMVLHL